MHSFTIRSLSARGIYFLLALAICVATTSVSQAQSRPQRPQRPPMVTGPYPLPILAALPKREDNSFYTLRDVPHGKVETTNYIDIAGKEKRMHVYLPHGFQEGKETYPVLYLNHGGGDDDSRWTATDSNGGHDWSNWRRYLWQTTQIMFPGSQEIVH